MALLRNETYVGRFEDPTAQQPQGAFKNRTTANSQDGSYLEAQWLNDWSALFSSMLQGGGIVANGQVDAVGASQYYTALLNVVNNEIDNSTVFVKKAGDTMTGDLTIDASLFSKTIDLRDYYPNPMSDLFDYSGFIRNTTVLVDGIEFKNLAIHCAHPDLGKDYSRGVAFDFGDDSAAKTYTYRFDENGVYQGTARIYTEWDKPTPAEIDCVNSVGVNVSSGTDKAPFFSCGFIRANNIVMDGLELPDLNIHCKLQNTSSPAYSRGIGFEYGDRTGSDAKTYTYRFDENSDYAGRARIYTEWDKPSAAELNVVPTTRTVNGKALSANISISRSDLGITESGTASGYLRVGNSLIQWMQVSYTTANTWQRFNFPIAFPNRCGSWSATYRSSTETSFSSVIQGNATAGSRTQIEMSGERSGTYFITAVGN